MEQSGPLIDECPEILEWWDEGNTIPIENLTRGSHYVANLKCPACGIRIQRDIHSVIGIRRDGRVLPVACPECGYSSEGNPEDNLLMLCPSIAEWWDYEKNAPYGPEQFTAGASFKAHLRCPDCGLELYSSVGSLLSRDETGNVIIRHEGRCRKYKALESENNLVKNYPEIEEWWDYDKNEGERPEEYTLYSPKRAHFKCPDCGNETFSRIVDAFSLGEDGNPRLFDCPVCNERKARPGFNSLAARAPDLVESEWCELENTFLGIDPDKVLPWSTQKVWWKCPTCERKYAMRVSDRMMRRKRGYTACPQCHGRRWVRRFNV